MTAGLSKREFFKFKLVGRPGFQPDDIRKPFRCVRLLSLTYESFA